MEPLLPQPEAGLCQGLQRALCSLTTVLGAGRQWGPLGHPQTRGTGHAHSWKLCCPAEKQKVPPSWLCVVMTMVLLHCPAASTAPSTASSPWSTAHNPAECQGHGYHAQSLLWNTQRSQWSCWEASQESRAAGSPQDSGSVTLLAHSLHHRNLFLRRILWSSLFPMLWWL